MRASPANWSCICFRSESSFQLLQNTYAWGKCSASGSNSALQVGAEPIKFDRVAPCRDSHMDQETRGSQLDHKICQAQHFTVQLAKKHTLPHCLEACTLGRYLWGLFTFIARIDSNMTHLVIEALPSLSLNWKSLTSHAFISDWPSAGQPRYCSVYHTLLNIIIRLPVVQSCSISTIALHILD